MDDSDDVKKYDFSFLKPNEATEIDKTKRWFKVSEILGIKGTSQLNSYYKKNQIEEEECTRDFK